MNEMFFLITGSLNYLVLLLFGVVISAAFLDILHKKSIPGLFFATAACFVIQTICYSIWDMNVTRLIYPLITHLPVILIYRFYFKQSLVSSYISVACAYLFCAISGWGSFLATSVTGLEIIGFLVRILINILIAYLILRYVARAIHAIMNKSTRSLIVFGFVPTCYYIFDYLTTFCSDLLYSGNKVICEFPSFILSLAFFLFCILYFGEYEQRREFEQQNQLMEIKATEAMKIYENIQSSEYKLSLLRHDMRHFLQNIAAYLDEGDTQGAAHYLKEMSQAIDETVLHKYSQNRLVDMILSSYENRIHALNIKANYKIEIPQDLPYPEVDITSILSNALENAIHAQENLPIEQRSISLSMKMKGAKLLLSLKNPYAETPVLVDGIPQTMAPGHGYGTKSIKYVCEKLGGNCVFSIEDEQFTLRIIL